MPASSLGCSLDTWFAPLPNINMYFAKSYRHRCFNRGERDNTRSHPLLGSQGVLWLHPKTKNICLKLGGDAPLHSDPCLLVTTHVRTHARNPGVPYATHLGYLFPSFFVYQEACYGQVRTTWSNTSVSTWAHGQHVALAFRYKESTTTLIGDFAPLLRVTNQFNAAKRWRNMSLVRNGSILT
jgi:hypothetical protein